MDERLLDLYNTELRHLRETAAEFAREFPKIAGRLAIDRDAKEICPDPYVERLMEGFAFMAARVHLKLDAEFPRFTQGLLETIYPDYLCPVPSMCVVRFDPEPGEGSLAPGFVVPRGTALRSQLGKGDRTACTFTTAADVRLLPLELVEVRYFTRDLAELGLPPGSGARAALRLRLKKTVGLPWKEIRVDPLVVHLRGGDELPALILEQLCAHARGIVVQAGAPRRRVLGSVGADSVRRHGLSPRHALLPPSARTFEGHRLLREYFAFAQRFLFVELAGFGGLVASAEGEHLDLVVLLGRDEPRLEGRVERSSCELFATPAINLFPKQLDRVLLSDRFAEFHVVADRNRPLDFEVYQVESVTGYGEVPDDECSFRPFYQARDVEADGQSAYFTLNRVPRLLSAREKLTGRRSTYGGSDVFLSLVDASHAPYRSDLRQLGIRALCTNRHLPLQMSVGNGNTDFDTEFGAPITGIRVLSGPTRPLPSRAEGRFAWRLISLLSLNHFSLTDGSEEEGARGLRELLSVLTPADDPQLRKQIDGLRSVATRVLHRRVYAPGPITFARGLEVKLVFDESSFEGTGCFLLGSVLDEFLARHVTLNSFTETLVTSIQRKEIIRWPARLGRRAIL